MMGQVHRALAALACMACGAILSPASAAIVTLPLTDSAVVLSSAFTASKTLASFESLHGDVPQAVGLGAVSSTTVNATAQTGAYTTPTFTTPVTTLSLDNITGEVRQFITSGGMRISTLAGAAALSIAGGQVSIEDLDIRIAADHSAEVYGRLRGQSATGVVVDASELLFRVNSANVSGINFASGSPWPQFTLSGMALTSQGFEDMATALGITSPDALSYMLLQATANNFGSLRIAAPAMVPEPTSLALMALGLAGLATATRRSGHSPRADVRA